MNKHITTINSSSSPIIEQCYLFNKFHHSENLSNPLTVSMTLMRLIPFCNFQWKINQGWDIKERLFTSIPSEFSITSSTKYEFSPEVYSFPEVFQNLNNLILQNREPFNLELPKWSKDAPRFIEIHKYFLECNEVRKNLNHWLDLTFGVHLKENTSIEHKNKYSELSYFNPLDPIEKQRAKHQWMVQCGQVPKCIFNEIHQSSKPTTHAPKYIKFILNPSSPPQSSPLKYSHIYSSITFYHNSIPTSFSCPIFSFIKHVDISGSYIAITSAISLVYVMRVFEHSGLKMTIQSHFSVDAPKYSLVYEKLMLCLTVTQSELTVWSIASSRRTCTIPVRAASFLRIDDNTDSLFVASGCSLYQYTLNGSLVRALSLPARITSLRLLSYGHSVFDLRIIVGLFTGDISVVRIDIATSEFAAAPPQHLSNHPILETRAAAGAVEVFDSEALL